MIGADVRIRCDSVGRASDHQRSGDVLRDVECRRERAPVGNLPIRVDRCAGAPNREL